MIYDFNAGRLSTFNIIEINNSIKFCQAIDAEGSGQTAYKNYLFLTIKNSDCLIIKMPVVYTDCQSYLVGAGGSTTQTDNYRSCVQSNIQTSQTLKEILSTFKFIKN
jgi:hypothetical protein